MIIVNCCFVLAYITWPIPQGHWIFDHICTVCLKSTASSQKLCRSTLLKLSQNIFQKELRFGPDSRAFCKKQSQLGMDRKVVIADNKIDFNSSETVSFSSSLIRNCKLCRMCTSLHDLAIPVVVKLWSRMHFTWVDCERLADFERYQKRACPWGIFSAPPLLAHTQHLAVLNLLMSWCIEINPLKSHLYIFIRRKLTLDFV